MFRVMREFVNLTLALSLALSLPCPVVAQGKGNMPADISPEEFERHKRDSLLAYYASLDHEMPEVAKIALEPAEDLWVIKEGELLDNDPFFMRTQGWQSAAQPCAEDICFSKDPKGNLNLVMAGEANALNLKQPLTPILETSKYLFLSADSDQIFRDRMAGDQNPGEGVFYIAKGDLLFAGEKKMPVPVFYFPLPGNGWTGKNDHAFEFAIADKVVLYNKSGFGLPIDTEDIELLEKNSRQNLVLSQLFGFLDGNVDRRGVALPKPHTTMLFGTGLSGQTTDAAMKAATFGKIDLSILPKAYADETAAVAKPKPSLRERIMDEIRYRAIQLQTLGVPDKNAPPKPAKKEKDEEADGDFWLKMGILGGMLGFTGTTVALTYDPVNFTGMITEDTPKNLASIAQKVGIVAVASVAMKYSIFKAKFDEIYPKAPDATLIQKLHQEHKGIMTSLAHGFYFSMSAIPTTMRHTLEFLKDHFVPSNKALSKFWDLTMGFQMRTNQKIPMNWKTQYYGWMFGLVDSVMVGVYLLVYGPWLINHMGWELSLGGAGAAYASAEVIRNFLAYLQSGAHNYSAEVKFIHMKSAENEARKILRGRGENPDAGKNAQELSELTEKALEKRYASVGLPGKKEFLYDPITALEGVVKTAGFGSAEAKAAMPNARFVLENRHWGLVQPALNRALKVARDMQAKAPSEHGAKTIKLLEWAATNRSAAKRIANRLWDATASEWGADGLRDSVAEEVTGYLASLPSPEYISYFGSTKAYIKGTFKYLVKDGAAEARDIREVLYLLSTNGRVNDVIPYMPASWREHAGSDEAAAAGAELFHRAFYSYLEHDKQLIVTDDILEAEFGARANAVLDRAQALDPGHPVDPFLREVRYREIMHRMKAKDEARRKVMNYQPKKISGLAQKQWEIVRARATGMWATADHDASTETWTDVSAKYTEVSGDEISDVSQWTKAYRYRLTVARAFAKEVGLEVNDASESEYVQKVIVAAAAGTEAELAQTNEQFYTNRLGTKDREFYEAQIFTKHFMDQYVSASVHDTDAMRAQSPEFPGRMQKVRKMIVGMPGEKLISFFVRSAESAFRNEETSYRAGWISRLERNIPIVPDAIMNFTRNLRVMPYFLTFSYLTSYYVWNIHTPYALWAVTLLIGFANPTLVELNNRWQRFMNFKPMGDVPSKLIFGWTHSFLTNPELILVQSYSQPLVNGFDSYVVQPVKRTGEACVDLLKPGAAPTKN